MTIIFGVRTKNSALVSADCRATSSDGEIKTVQKIFPFYDESGRPYLISFFRETPHWNMVPIVDLIEKEVQTPDNLFSSVEDVITNSVLPKMKQKEVELKNLGLGVWLVYNDQNYNPKLTIGSYDYSTERCKYRNYDFGNVKTFNDVMNEKIKHMLITEQLDYYNILCKEEVPFNLGTKISYWIIKRYPKKYKDELSGSGVQMVILKQKKFKWIHREFET